MTLLTFSSVVRFEFLNWDDEPLLLQNQAYRGFSAAHLRWIFSSTLGGHYQPLTWLSYAVDYRLWGSWAGGYHLTNVLLHTCAAVVFYRVAFTLVSIATLYLVAPSHARRNPTNIGTSAWQKPGGGGTPARADARSSQALAGTLHRPESNTSESGAHDVAPRRSDPGSSCCGADSVDRDASSQSIPVALTLGACVSALFFAVHPLRVESVAWITERRDVLSGLFLLLSFHQYLRFAAAPGRRPQNLVASVLLYVLSLLSKASGMTYPLILLVIDAFPLRRFSGRAARSPRSDGQCGCESVTIHPSAGAGIPAAFAPESTPRRVILEKAAFAVPALAAAILAVHAQRESGALWTFSDHPLSLRVAQACYGILFYIEKTLAPLGLCPLYEQPTDAQVFASENIVGAVFVVGATIFAVRMRRRLPAVTAAWACYLLLVAPVLGLAQSGPQLVADRYSYLSCLPWAILFGAGVALAVDSGDGATRRVVRWPLALAGVVVVGLILGSRDQAQVWRNSEALWTYVVERAPRTGLAHTNLAALYNERLRFTDARRHADEALAILPGNRTAHIAAATASLALGDPGPAERHFRRALEIADRLGRADPYSSDGLARSLAQQNRVDEAVDIYRDLSEAAPDDARWPLAAGTLLAQADRWDDARIAFERAARLAPESATAALRLGVAWMKLGAGEKAVEVWRAGLQRSPGDAALQEQLAKHAGDAASEQPPADANRGDP